MSGLNSPTSLPTLARLTRRSVTLAAGLALTGGLLALPTVSSAAVECGTDAAAAATSASPASAVVGTTKTKTLTLDVHTAAGCTDAVVAAVQDPRGAKRLVLTKVGVTQGGRDHWRARLSLAPASLDNSDAGAWPVRYDVVSGELVQTLRIDAHVQRAARMTFNAGPEPIRGNRITYSGTLERASWDAGRYVAYRDHRVLVEAYEPEEHQFEPVATLVTRADGTFRATRTYRGDGEYRSVSAPSLTTQRAVSRVDSVAAAR